MAESDSRAKPMATPRQLLVVGVLGVVLVSVLIGQFSGASSQPGKAAVKATPKGPVPQAGQAIAPKSAAPAAQATTPKAVLEPWPELTAEVAAQYDPFAVPEPLARRITEIQKAKPDRKPNHSPPKRDLSAENVAALKAKGITLIVRSQGGAVAMVGNRAVRVGDVLEGHRVVSIELDGVVLAPIEGKESNEVHK